MSVKKRGGPGQSILSVVAHVFGLKALEALNRDMLHQSEHFLFGILILIALPSHADPDTSRHMADTGTPNEFVQLCVDAHVFCAHNPCCELPDCTDGLWCAFFELDPMHILVEVNSVVPGAWLLALALAGACLRHA
eukprot:CAMPEP_0170592144 /NCGR_PEP_ID=MMETSP0224-20130122/12774_1 /TAXON_ID=285029 /ORGANISM="Togula jolla, Strain CCCM 725" /LENGTH=135 /DNA_ID=CAMNT_0010916043 /DNA_START=33 /DNA_END=440 /DNA_ORIENTATION=-